MKTLLAFWAMLLAAQGGRADPGDAYADAFKKYERTGNRELLDSNLRELLDSNLLDSELRGAALQAQVTALLDVISSSADEWERNTAIRAFFWIARRHPFAASLPDESQIFRPAIAVFESHLNETGEEESVWAPQIAGLTSAMGFQPSAAALSLIYRMTSYQNVARQYVAFDALARIQPFPADAKELFRVRLQTPGNGLSVEHIIHALQLALPDPDALKIALAAAESDDVAQQDAATYILSVMDPLPASVVAMFRKLRLTDHLTPAVAENVERVLGKVH